MIDNIIMQEFSTEIHDNFPDGQLEDWANEYEFIMGELNQYLVDSLRDESQWNEELALIQDQNFS